MITIPRTIGQPHKPYHMIIIGALEIKVPNTGTKPNINTINASVSIYGNVHPVPMTPMSVSQIVVSSVLIRAIMPWARNMSQKPFQNFSAITDHSS